MTTGSNVSNLTTSVATYDQLLPSGTIIPRGDYPKGFYWSKTWSGTDSSPLPSSVLDAYWVKVDRQVDMDTGGPPRPKYTYLQKWEMRRNRPRQRYPDHPYSATFSMWSDDEITYQIKSVYPPYDIEQRSLRTFKQLFGAGYSASGEWNGNDTIALQGKLREKIVGSDFDMGVFLGEGREALNLITDTATRLFKAYRAVRVGDLAKAARALGAKPPPLTRYPRQDVSNKRLIAQHWLELQYGWMPLIQDAQGAAQALAQQLNNPAVQTYRARKRKKLKIVLVSSNINSYSFPAWETRAQLIARLSEVNVATLNGLTDPASVIWELTPWSFVADWFIPIGNYLSARGLSSAISGTFVTTISREVRFNVFSVKLGGSTYSMLKSGNYHSWDYTVNRTVSDTLSTPAPSFKPLSEVLSWKRAANAVALLVTNFGSGGKSNPFR